MCPSRSARPRTRRVPPRRRNGPTKRLELPGAAVIGTRTSISRKGRKYGKRRKHPVIGLRSPLHELDPGGVARSRKFALYGEMLRATGRSAGGFLARSAAFATIPSPPLDSRSNQYWAPSMRFPRHGGIYRSDVGLPEPNPEPRPNRLPPGATPTQNQRTRREDHALLIVHDEFRPAIPRSGWSPPEPVSASPALAE